MSVVGKGGGGGGKEELKQERIDSDPLSSASLPAWPLTLRL